MTLQASSSFPEELPPRTKPVVRPSFIRRLRDVARFTFFAYSLRAPDKARRFCMSVLLFVLTGLNLWNDLVAGYRVQDGTLIVGSIFTVIGLVIDAWAIAVIGTSRGITVRGYYVVNHPLVDADGSFRVCIAADTGQRQPHLDIFLLLEGLLSIFVVMAPFGISGGSNEARTVGTVLWWLLNLIMVALAWTLARFDVDAAGQV